MTRRVVVWAALAALPGCAAAPAPAAGTGAREVAHRFFEAVAAEDWAAAYDVLAPESKARVAADRFAKLGRDYRGRLGFAPTAVRVTTCDEHGADAVAHVTLSGRGGHQARFKDAAALKRGDAGWAVVLSPKFGAR